MTKLKKSPTKISQTTWTLHPIRAIYNVIASNVIASNVIASKKIPDKRVRDFFVAGTIYLCYNALRQIRHDGNNPDAKGKF